MVPTGPHSRAPVATNENLTFAAMTAEYKAEMRQAKADDDYKPKLWDGRRWIPRSWTGPVLEHDDARDLEVRVEGAVGRLSEILGDGMTREDALQYMTGLAANAVENHFRDDDDELAFDGARY